MERDLRVIKILELPNKGSMTTTINIIKKIQEKEKIQEKLNNSARVLISKKRNGYSRVEKTIKLKINVFNKKNRHMPKQMNELGDGLIYISH